MNRIALNKIVIDAGTQIRAAINETVVTDYAERMSEGVTFPPVVLFHDGNQYYLADGFHRCLAGTRVGFTQIDAEIHGGTQTDALWYALGANKTNGQRLTTADKKNAVKLAIQAWPERSAAVISEQVGCSASYVGTIKVGLSTTVVLPDRVIGRDGTSYPASPSAATRARDEAKRLLTNGESVDAVRKATGIGRENLQELRRGMGLSVDKTRAGMQKRRAQMQAMASDGHTSRQIATAVGLTEESCRLVLRKAGIDVPADKVTRGTHRHDSNRILDRIAMDAENLIEGVNLIEFADLDRSRVAGWLTSLKDGRDKLGELIRRLMKEQQNGEAA